MKFDILTIFPEFFDGPLDVGIIRRAREAKIIEVDTVDIREFATDKHRKVDDRPFGGGEGMVMKPEPIFRAAKEVLGTNSRDEYPPNMRFLFMSPQGVPFGQEMAREMADQTEQIVLLCGRYEGIDERVMELVTDEVSIGDYVLSGGEPAALAVIDTVTRLLPGALGNESSSINESFTSGMLDCPQYTQPRDYEGRTVPDVLLSGNHKEIENWRKEKALEKTKRVRRDLLEE